MLQGQSPIKFSTVEDDIITDLKNNSKKCIITIENNKSLIKENLKFTLDFVPKLNNILLSGLNDYILVDKVLNHEYFTQVLSEFRESDILVRACQNNDKKLVRWLLTKNINYAVQDKFGRTALIYAAQHYTLLFAVEDMIKGNREFINFADVDGNTALFYGATNINILEKMLKAPFDINHVNNNNENILLYNCRYDAYKSFSKVLKLNLDPNLVNNVGRTAAMYLVEHGRYFQLKEFISKYHIDVNYQNKFGESLVTVLIKKYRSIYNDFSKEFFTESNYLAFKNYASTLIELVKLGCDFNIIIDDNGNTALLYFLLSEEYVCASYILKKCSLNLSVMNNFGVSAPSLVPYLNQTLFDCLDYYKKRNAKKFSMNTLKKLLKKYPSEPVNYDSVVASQNRYYPTARTPLVQQWFLEVLYPTVGAVPKRRTQLTNANGSYIFPGRSVKKIN